MRPTDFRKVYDVTDRASFTSLPTWFKELDTFSTNTQAVKIVVGNKVDEVRLAFTTSCAADAFLELRPSRLF